ncbi:UNVERIFIED_CONTAM: hypothetical protein Sradi_0443500 [Sesamum radiatum]|uniref:Uncharacterized protein n=1 Tax=Sesamum radiatum TaxID=300843 RepID=A0AAW2W9G8_SESRA
MDSEKGWFKRLQSRNSSTEKKEPMGSERGDAKPPMPEEVSTLTRQRAAAAKQYIENHYKEQMRNLQERRERYGTLSLHLYFSCVAEYFCSMFLHNASICSQRYSM